MQNRPEPTRLKPVHWALPPPLVQNVVASLQRRLKIRTCLMGEVSASWQAVAKTANALGFTEMKKKLERHNTLRKVRD